ncbi:AraC family transcriptional regulator [Pseudomonas marginalis]|uniref:AraC family transcriptional regulator n=1 Tax=Pseudomonas marginalis TaxID=298 RepID=A0A9X9BPK9_PSEMA|nr:AraC family transcriptional regulator [Pseudomonas marginalis]TWR56182.1 AraC family transcriptional regulator [Pseudomonas marginalis]SEB61251.1 AraC-type DNA-binding protein [Pseudomonas marginalis]
MIKAAKIQIYLRLLKGLGFGSQQVLGETTLVEQDLLSNDALISREDYYAVIHNSLELTGDPGMAFSLDSVANISDYGILGYAMLSSSTLRGALQIRRQFHNSLFGTMVCIESARDLNAGYELIFTSAASTETLRRFEIEEFLVEGMALVKVLTGIYPTVRSVSFAYPEPSYSALYKSFFKCPVEFGASKTVLNVKSPSLNTPILSNNPGLHDICTQHCKDILALHKNTGDLHSCLREVFLKNPGQIPELPTVAEELGISERSLRRKLASDGLSFQGMKDQFRLDLSHQLLIAGKMAPKEIAYFLGFSTPSAFSRAFKAWTGQTIQQFLQAHRTER